MKHKEAIEYFLQGQKFISWVKHPNTNAYISLRGKDPYFIKIYQLIANYNQERLILEKLKGSNIPNVPKIISNYVIKIESVGNYYAITTTFFQRNSLLDYYSHSNKPFSNQAIYIILTSLVQNLKVLHQNKIYHQNLIFPNIVFDNQFKLKIVGFRQSTQDYEKIDFHVQKCFEEFAPPQIYDYNYPHQSSQVDIFQLGVLLIYLKTKKIAFRNTTNDLNYINIVGKIQKSNLNQKNLWTTFWKRFSKEIEIEDSFKNLVQQMIRKNPKERISLNQILQSQWVLDLKNINLNNDLLKKQLLEIQKQCLYLPKNIENNNISRPQIQDTHQEESVKDYVSENNLSEQDDNQNYQRARTEIIRIYNPAVDRQLINQELPPQPAAMLQNQEEFYIVNKSIKLRRKSEDIQDQYLILKEYYNQKVQPQNNQCFIQWIKKNFTTKQSEVSLDSINEYKESTLINRNQVCQFFTYLAIYLSKIDQYKHNFIRILNQDQTPSKATLILESQQQFFRVEAIISSPSIQDYRVQVRGQLIDCINKKLRIIWHTTEVGSRMIQYSIIKSLQGIIKKYKIYYIKEQDKIRQDKRPTKLKCLVQQHLEINQGATNLKQQIYERPMNRTLPNRSPTQLIQTFLSSSRYQTRLQGCENSPQSCQNLFVEKKS